MSKKTEFYRSCPLCGAGAWEAEVLDGTIIGYTCNHCDGYVPVEYMPKRPIEDALRADLVEAKTDAYTLSDMLAQANAEIERLKAPHPTCETCGQRDIDCEELRVTGYDMCDMAYSSDIDYCSAHTALKKDGER